MNDQAQIQQALEQWLTDFVEINHVDLANWAPCPYARAARQNELIVTVFVSVSELKTAIDQGIQQLDHKDVVIICFDHHSIDASTLQEFVTGINRDLMPRDYVVLDDHPHSPEYVNGVKMNFGHCALLLLQKLSKLNTASDRLRSQGYYQAWDAKALDQVVTWRYK